jgi:WD40 repeat protein
VRIWDAATGTVLQTFEGHSNWVKAVAFSPDGKRLASGSDDRTVRLWDAATGTVLQTFECHSDAVKAVALSPDGKRLASGSSDGKIRIWDAATGTLLQTFEIATPVQALTFSADGFYLEIDRGVLDLMSLSLDTASSRSNLSRDMFIKEDWVTQGMKNLLWLPPDYRPDKTAVWGRVLGLGYASGLVLILEFT